MRCSRPVAVSFMRGSPPAFSITSIGAACQSPYPEATNAYRQRSSRPSRRRSGPLPPPIQNVHVPPTSILLRMLRTATRPRRQRLPELRTACCFCDSDVHESIVCIAPHMRCNENECKVPSWHNHHGAYCSADALGRLTPASSIPTPQRSSNNGTRTTSTVVSPTPEK